MGKSDWKMGEHARGEMSILKFVNILNSCRHLALIIEGAGADINVDPVLHAACSLDLQKFCRDIPPGEAKD